MVSQTQGQKYSKFLASAATPSLIKFVADPEHPPVNAGELVNTLLLKWRLLYLKWTPHGNCQHAPEKHLSSEFHWNSKGRIFVQKEHRIRLET